MFMVQGLTLLIQNKPGGSIGDQFGAFITSDLVPDKVPMSAAVLVVALLVWTFVKRTRFGVGLYALGSDPDGAYANGMPVRGYRIATYALAGMFYAAAGLYVSAQTGSADPLVGRPLLLSMFTAVVLGGTWLGGGRGGCVGTGVRRDDPDDHGQYPSGAQRIRFLYDHCRSGDPDPGGARVVGRKAVGGASLRALRRPMVHGVALTGTRARNDPGARRVKFEVEDFRTIENTELKGRVIGDWIERNREWVKYVVPAYLLFFAVIAITGVVYGPGVLASANFLYQLADADLVPGGVTAGARRRDPDRRARSVRALAHHAVGRIVEGADAWRQRSRGVGRAAGALRCGGGRSPCLSGSSRSSKMDESPADGPDAPVRGGKDGHSRNRSASCLKPARSRCSAPSSDHRSIHQNLSNPSGPISRIVASMWT